MPFTFAPDPIGGTEIYVDALARSLRSHGIESLVAASCDNGMAPSYEYDGLRVRRFRSETNAKDMLRELYGGGDPQAAAAFGQVLDEECPHAVHVHAFTRAVSLLLVRAAKQRGLPVFFTYHTPTVSCQRGTLMLHGKEPCDGMLNVWRCTTCSLEAQGLPTPAAELLSHIPLSFGRALEKVGLSGGLWTALRMTELIRASHTAIHALLCEVDGIVAFKQWVHALLVRNGIPASKIIISEHGLPDAAHPNEPIIEVAERPLRVAFFGRADWVKGADTLVQAVQLAPALDIEVHLYGVMQSATDQKYWTELKRLAAEDERIKFLPAVSHGEVVALLRRYHLLAVPSRWLETGPLVVLEAFGAGIPVLGSDLGGIAQWVRHGENGLLLEFNKIRAWADAFKRCAEDRAFLASLRCGVKEPRSMGDVADDMQKLYRKYVYAA